MNENSCVVTGSFDPITRGHMHLIREAAELFPRVVVAVLNSASKQYMFSEAERITMVNASCAGIESVRTVAWSGLLVDLLDYLGADIILRGFRDARDIEYERQMAEINARLRPGTRTLWVASSSEDWAVSSTIVRELLTYGGNTAPFVPAEIAPLLMKYREDRNASCRSTGEKRV